jgi:voltage-gated potassium channel
VRTSAPDVELRGVRPRESRLQRVFDIATALAAILTVPVVAGLALDPSDAVEQALMAVNWLLWGAFALELATMLAISSDRGGWLRRHPITPVLVVLTPPVFAGLTLFRLVRLLRGAAARRIADGVTSAEGLRNVALLTLLTVAFGGLLFASIEPDVGIGDGLYWAVTTVTTTGYGDIVPTTETSKALAVYIMLIGAAFLAILTGAIAQRFVGRWQRAAAGGEEPAAALGPGSAVAAREDAVLAKLDELGERMAALERAVSRGGG